MIAFFRDILRALYKPLLMVLLFAALVLLWYVPREQKTEEPIWIEVVTEPKTGQCEVTLWAGGRLMYSLVSDQRTDLNDKTCQIYILNH